MTHDLDKGRIANATTDPGEREEIEVTPEMIEASVEAYHAHGRALKNDVPGEPELLVTDVFRDMLARARRPLKVP